MLRAIDSIEKECIHRETLKHASKVQRIGRLLCRELHCEQCLSSFSAKEFDLKEHYIGKICGSTGAMQDDAYSGIFDRL